MISPELREMTDDVAELFGSEDEDDSHGLLSAHPADETPFGCGTFMEPLPSPISELESHEDNCFSPDDNSCCEYKPLITSRQHGTKFRSAISDSDVSTPGHKTASHEEVRVLSPSGEYLVPATHLPFGSTGPAVWTVNNEQELTEAINILLTDHLQRRSRGHAASQGAARFAIGLVRDQRDCAGLKTLCIQVLEVWKVVFDHLVEEVLRTN